MNDRECLRTSTNVWRSVCDHCELMANCIRKHIRHTFATVETSITFETPRKRPRIGTYEQLRMSGDHLRSLRIHGELHSSSHSPYIRHSVRLALKNATCAWKIVPDAPSCPFLPVTPGAPVAPLTPWGPCTPCTPWIPCNPKGPGGPTTPCGPSIHLLHWEMVLSSYLVVLNFVLSGFAAAVFCMSIEATIDIGNHILLFVNLVLTKDCSLY